MKGHRRPRQAVHHYPNYGYGYGYDYDPYWRRRDYYRRGYQQPPYVVMQQPKAPQPRKTQISLHLPTILASVGLSYLLWGRG